MLSSNHAWYTKAIFMGSKGAWTGHVTYMYMWKIKLWLFWINIFEIHVYKLKKNNEKSGKHNI